jgi:hypothetical protein
MSEIIEAFREKVRTKSFGPGERRFSVNGMSILEATASILDVSIHGKALRLVELVFLAVACLTIYPCQGSIQMLTRFSYRAEFRYPYAVSKLP